MNVSRIDYKWTALVAVATGILMLTLDEGSVRIILPALGTAFEATVDDVVWVWLIYLLIGAGLVLALGRIGDAFGRKRIYTGGLVLFTIGLALSAVAPGLAELIAFRAVQAVGAAMVVAMANAIVTASFPAQERGRALGIMATVVSVGLLGGPAIGGALVDWLGWRSVFYARIPVCILAIGLAIFLLRKDPLSRRDRGFDIAGATTLFLGLASILVAINRGQSAGWTSPLVLGLVALGIVLLGGFVRIERKAADPVLDLSLFSGRVFASASVTHALFYISTISVRFVLPYFLLLGLSLPATTAGLLLAVIPGARALLSPLSGRLSDRTGAWVLTSSGVAVVGAGVLLMLTLDSDATTMDLVPLLAIVGIGVGLFVAPNTSTIMGCVSKDRLGTASAMVATTRQIGSSLGLAVAGMVFTHTKLVHAGDLLAQGVPPGLVETQSIVAGFRTTLVASLVFALAGLLVMLLVGRTRPTDERQQANL
ncbi:MAG: MFS transporter [Chloroflexi bacterium]|nr:MFS transporter [Chloroflexota bacterium]